MNKDVTLQFLWFIGIVEDIDDPLQLGRLRVRIYNAHTHDKTILPTTSLPWASVIVPVTAGALTGVGLAPVGTKVGTTVVGFFADSSEKQIPVVLGCLPGITDGEETKHDVTLLARGQQLIEKPLLGPEPASSYGAAYPFNRALKTVSGHFIEVDDTPGKERIHVYHKSGTYVEISADGTRVDKTNGKSYRISNGNDTVYINGDASIEVTGSTVMNVQNDVSMRVGGSMSIGSGGSININASGTFSVAASKITLDDGNPTDKF